VNINVFISALEHLGIFVWHFQSTGPMVMVGPNDL